VRERAREPSSPLSGDEQLLLEEYRMLSSLWQYEGSLFWQRHTVYLLVETALLALLGHLLTRETRIMCEFDPVGPMAIALGIAGLTISVCWLGSTARARDYYKLWAAAIRSIEERVPPLSALSAGQHHFARGCTDFGGKLGKARASWLGSRFPAASWSMMLPGVFLLLWLGGLVLGVLVLL
jgi:hypothetical protein